MRANITGIFAPQNLREFLLYDLLYHFNQLGRGFVMYHIVEQIAIGIIALSTSTGIAAPPPDARTGFTRSPSNLQSCATA